MGALQLKDPRHQPGSAEHRRHARVQVALLGRYMLEDYKEYPCLTVDMSPGGALIDAPVQGQIGGRVVVYLEHIGRIEGRIVRLVPRGFAMTIVAAARKRDKIASQLTWLANRNILGLPEDRRHERITPVVLATVLRFESGREIPVRLIDVSMSGAAISTESRPQLNTPVVVGHTPGKVVRHFANGIAVEFRLPLSPDKFDDRLVL